MRVYALVLSPFTASPPCRQIQALAKHVSQYTNETALAEDLAAAGADIARQAGIPGYAEGFLPVVEMS